MQHGNTCQTTTTGPTDPFTSPQARSLRRRIQAIRIKRLGWSDYVFHYVMEHLGFGTSLRALPDYRLHQLYSLLRNYRPSRPAGFEYTSENRYIYHLQRKAGWSDLTLRHFLTVTFHKTHLNLLTPDERECVRRVLDDAFSPQPTEKKG